MVPCPHHEPHRPGHPEHRLRPRRLPGPPGRDHRPPDRRRRCPAVGAHGRRQVGLLPDPGPAAAGHGGGGLAPDRPDAGPGGRPAASWACGRPSSTPARSRRRCAAPSPACWPASWTCCTWRPSACCRSGPWTCWTGWSRGSASPSSPSTRPTASPSGVMTSGRSTCSWTCWPSAFPACPAWPAPRRRTSAPAPRSSPTCAWTGGRVFVSGFDRPNIRYRVQEKDNARRQLLAFLRREHAGDAGIVYCLSRKGTEADGRLPGGQRHRGPALPCGPDGPAAPLPPGALPARGRPGDGGDHRLRHGHRQAGRALRGPPRPAQVAWRPTTRRPAAPAATACRPTPG